MASNDEYFVGRRSELSKLDEEWRDNRIFGIYGLRAIGKSSLVAEFIKTRGIPAIFCECSTAQTQGSLTSLVCSKLGLEPDTNLAESDAWIEHICEALQEHDSDITVVFDNAEDTIESPASDIFLKLCDALVEHCPNVKTIISSTTKVIFPKLSQVYFSLELTPLRPKESLELFTVAAPGVDLGSYADAILELCEGLPLLILLIAAELQGDGGFITPADMVELLLECRLETVSNSLSYPNVDEVYRKFILRLKEVYRDNLVTLDYIPGSFTAYHAKEMLGMDSEARTKAFALRPIRVRHVLNYDTSDQRFNIQGILREVIRANFAIKNLEEIRSRYSKLFSRVMKDIAHRMGTCEYTKAIADFAVEQPNLRKFLHEVHHTKQDNYKFFIEVATSCTDLIEKFMAEESDTFYEGCLQLADMYGEVKDKATVHVAVGSVETLTKGNLQKGEHNYMQALRVLGKSEKSYEVAVLLKKLGWNIFKQGFCEQAIGYYQKSLDISQLGGHEYESLTLENLSGMATAFVVLGEFDTAEKYHYCCLKRSERLQGRVSPKVGSTINNMGLLYDQKGDHVKALELFQEGLDIKRKCQAAPISVVYSLSNVANSLNGIGKFAEAHAHVDEAFDILHNQKVPMLDGLSLMYNTRGKIFANEERWGNACFSFAKTVELSRKIEQKSYIFMKRLVNLAEVQEKNGLYNESLNTAKEALQLENETNKLLDHNTIVTECLQCMTRVYATIKDDDNFIKSLYSLEKECMRREKVCRKYNNNLWMDKANAVLSDVHNRLKSRNINVVVAV
ncbi:uncharacterized protein LOC128215606 isoform X2 [Mya arenaria]|uniref:uncharacterized protein LOC128215606 isoform X2 n=1 Tax=Mya arenaria TaxID=6604 RepID=UPI0022DEC763|nr:uncharacterized protein LOC128215606 isoform X2 [Mya arenaria]